MKAWIASLVLLVAIGASAMSTADYVASLEAIRASVIAGDLATARARATQLRGTQVDDFRADDSVLQLVLDTKAKRSIVVDRLTSTIDALRTTAVQPVDAVDANRLERLRRDEAASELRRGGEVLPAGHEQSTLVMRFVEMIGNVLSWIWDQLVRFFEWLLDFWPARGKRAEAGGTSFGMRWLVIAVVAGIVVLLSILALEVIRRGRRRAAEPEAQSVELSSSRDEDPLSRGANEWEIYAAKLAAAGRIREAIRAWYHAVLVTLYGAGILHFRKGRTNWEYISALSPDHAWRPDFVQLTRRFEIEWYGHIESTSDALDDCSEQAREILSTVRRRRGAA